MGLVERHFEIVDKNRRRRWRPSGGRDQLWSLGQTSISALLTSEWIQYIGLGFSPLINAIELRRTQVKDSHLP